MLILVLAAALATVSATPPPSLPTPPRPPAHVLLVGIFHFADPGLDSHVPENEVDIHSPVRQEELAELLDCLAAFAPSRIAVEALAEREDIVNADYRRYLADELTLSRNEIHQVAFRLARRLGLDRLHAVDAERRFYEPYVDPDEYAVAQGQAEALRASETPWEEYYREVYAREDDLKMRQSLRAHLLWLNDPQRVLLGHGHYLVGSFKAGVGDAYPGVDAKTAWYNRNLRIFANLQRITRGTDERILLLIGAGHLPILSHALDASPEYQRVELATVLGDACAAGAGSGGSTSGGTTDAAR